MKTYFEAYKERIEGNTQKFITLADKLVNNGFTVLKPSSVNISFIVILKDNKHINMQFSEVPYRWEFYRNIIPSPKHGSSVNVARFCDYEREFSVEEIEGFMCENYKSMEDKYNYLVKHSVNNNL